MFQCQSGVFSPSPRPSRLPASGFFWLNVKGKGGGLPHPEIRRQKRGSNYPPSLSHLSARGRPIQAKLCGLLASRFDSRGSNEKEAPSASAAQKPTPREGRSRVVSLSRGKEGGLLFFPFLASHFRCNVSVCVCKYGERRGQKRAL